MTDNDQTLQEMVIWQAGQDAGEKGNPSGGLKDLMEYLQWKETGLHAGDLHIEHGFNKDDNRGSSVLKLVSDWSWVHRRVESVQIITDGQTRRQLSFDFVLPNEPGLRWRPTEGHRGAAVPLTFLRKGMLVNLDIADKSGSSLPSLSTSENAQLTYQAMRMLAESLQLAEAAEKLFGDIGEVFGEILLLNSHRAQEGFSGRTTWEDVINKALLDIVMSNGYDTEAVDYKRMGRIQDVHRHDLFALAAQMSALTAVEDKAALRPDQLTMSLWVMGDGDKSTPLPLDRPRVFDSSVPIQVLACVIFNEIDLAVQLGRERMFLRQLELLCQLLSITSLSYLFTVVMDEEEVWPHTTEKNRTESRQLVKVSCDVEISDTRPEDWKQQLRALRRGAVKNWILFLPAVGILVRYSNWSAASTHLEFSPPENTAVKEIVAEQGSFLQEAHGTDDPKAPAIVKIGIPGGEPVPEGTRERYYRANGKPGSLKHKMMRRQLHVRHGSYRTSQGNVHVNQTRASVQPLDSLRFYLVPRLSGQPFLAALTALLITAFSGLVLWRQRQNRETPPEAWFDFSVFVAVETLVLAIFGALILTSGRHRVAREVWAGPRRLIIAATVLAVFAPLTGLPGLWEEEVLVRYIGLGSVTWGALLQGLLKLCGGLSLWLLGTAVLMHWRCRDDEASLREEKVIGERSIPNYRHRPYQNVVAVKPRVF